MSKLRTFSICVDDIPAEKLVTAKNGKRYLNLTSWDNDEPDKYGNDFSVSISQSKEEREAKNKKTYLGNVKVVWSNGSNVMPEPKGSEPRQAPPQSTADDLPF